MKWFLDLTTRGKLFAGFGLMIIFLAAAILTAYLTISAIYASQKNLYQQDFANAVDLLNIRSDENGMRVGVLGMILILKQAERAAQDLNHLSSQLRKFVTA